MALWSWWSSETAALSHPSSSTGSHHLSMAQLMSQMWTAIPYGSSNQQEISEAILKIMSLRLKTRLTSSDRRMED